MSESEEEYVYSDYEDEDDEEEGGSGGASGLSAQTEGAQGGDTQSSTPSKKFSVSTRCADNEIRLLSMTDILPEMQGQVGQATDLTGIPAAGAAALLRHVGWSSEKLLDRFWADRDGMMAEVGVEKWKDSGVESVIGTVMLSNERQRQRSMSGSFASPSTGNTSSSSASSSGANPQAAEDKAAAMSSSPGSAVVVDETNGFGCRELVLGLPAGCTGIALPEASENVECRICFSNLPPSACLAAPCGHFFCQDCYRDYLTTKLGEGPSVVFTKCPEHKCTTLVPPEIWAIALSPSPDKKADESTVEEFEAEFARIRARYSQFYLSQFITSNKQLRFCPGKDCNRIVMAGDGVRNVKCEPARMGCGTSFCFRCGNEAHAPSACDDLMRWTEKCQNESETANWILANTKRCPKCQTRIEKNQGCNHMTCSQCRYEFCWMCMGSWVDHGAQTGGYYKCNKYDPAAGDENEDSATKAKRELDRYLHYYKRYQGHKDGQKYAEKQLQQTEKRMVELQESSVGSSWIEVQYLKAANEMVIECRRVLKYTYVFGYYLPVPKEGEPSKHKELFEHLQENLERFTEYLSELTEMPIEKMVKTDIINNTRVVSNFLDNMLQGCEEGLDQVIGSDGRGGAAEAN